ncbi:MAG: phosphoribosylanthranilate isomerase [Acidobacteriaceae bacterium]|jgi:phosphoribosylanthranilate isomerase
MWIKICGNTNLEDARFAAECGAQAVGFVFAPSPRRVEADLVRSITEHLPPQLEKYGVFADAGFDEIVSTVNASGLTGVQLHRTSDPLLPSRLRQHFAARISILRVVHFMSPEFEQQWNELSRSEDTVLVDSSTPRAIGGTGTSFDWHKARSFLRGAPHLRWVAAGGLAPENVKQAIQTLRPWGVDVVSGVESAPGKKDPARVLAFIRSAQEASAELQETVAATKSTDGEEGRS